MKLPVALEVKLNTALVAKSRFRVPFNALESIATFSTTSFVTNLVAVTVPKFVPVIVVAFNVVTVATPALPR